MITLLEHGLLVAPEADLSRSVEDRLDGNVAADALQVGAEPIVHVQEVMGVGLRVTEFPVKLEEGRGERGEVRFGRVWLCFLVYGSVLLSR